MSLFQPTLILGSLVVSLYLLPSLIAVTRRTPHLITVFMVNVLLGWTVVGWMYSLAWAAFSNRRGEDLGELRLSLPLRNAALAPDRREVRPTA